MKGYCTLNSDASVKGNVAGYAFWIVSDGGGKTKAIKFGMC